MLIFEQSTQPVNRHLKILVFGGPGTGKTWFALHAPAPLVIDTESSTDAYRGRPDFAFWVARSAQPAEILEVLEHLAAHGGRIQNLSPQTLVVDSFSVLWQVRREAGERRAEQLARRSGKDAERVKVSYYDWAWVKRPLHRLFAQLVNMPLNVVITAREKAIYDEVGNGAESKLEISDYVPDIERSAEYVFDLVLRFYLDGDRRKAKVYKSRFDAFPPGTVIEDPRWELFAPLAQVGGTRPGLMPDLVAAAEAEAAPEPAAWTRDPKRVAKAQQWLAEQGLDDRDANAALGTDDWRTTALEPDEFKAAIAAYVARQTQADSAVDEARAQPAAGEVPAPAATAAADEPAPDGGDVQAAEPTTPEQPPAPQPANKPRRTPQRSVPDLRQIGNAISEALQTMADNGVEIIPAEGWGTPTARRTSAMCRNCQVEPADPTNPVDPTLCSTCARNLADAKAARS